MAVKMRHHATAFALVASIYWLVGLVPVFAVAGAMQACLQFNSSLSCPLTVGCEWKPATPAWITTHSSTHPFVATRGNATRGKAPASAATAATESGGGGGGGGGSGGSGWCVQEPIAQNFLMMKTKAWPDALTSLLLHGFVRLAVLLQLCTIFPLVCAVVRSQVCARACVRRQYQRCMLSAGSQTRCLCVIVRCKPSETSTLVLVLLRGSTVPSHGLA